MAAKLGSNPKKRDEMVQILYKPSDRSSGNYSVLGPSSCASTRNAMQMTHTAMMAPTTVLEIIGQVALGNYILIRKLN